jgi:L-asparaginase
MPRRVRILHTGGTLGMRPREPDQALAPDEFGSTVLEHVPELSELAEIDARVLCNVDSSDMSPALWMQLAREVERSLGSCDGVVITHGTDAMAYTASALSFVLRDLPRPVILTGSTRPLADIRSDGRANLVGAVDLALRDIPEVAIYFDGLLLRGNRAHKSTTFAFGAFTSPNCQPLAELGAELKPGLAPLRPRGPLRLEGGFDTRVAALWLVPGQSAGIVRAALASDVRAVLIVALGVGNLPVVEREMADAVRALHESGRVVACASQSENGRVDLDRYAGGRLARELGAVGIGDMTVEAAAVKLMYLLGTLEDPAAVRAALAVPIAGEIAG